MKRRDFIGTAAVGCSMIGPRVLWHQPGMKDVIIGHNSHRYKVDLHWGDLNPRKYPVRDCHEMVMDRAGRLYLLTNHTRNNVMIYNSSGRLVGSWGTEFPGAHGLTIKDEGGEEFLYISDNQRHEVIKTTLDGRVIMVLPYPAESGKYENATQYVPTETAIADNGDIYVADGYGLQYILQYSQDGRLINIFGGRGDEEFHLDNAHGICIDQRGGDRNQLLVTDRMKNKLKKFTLQGDHLGSIHLPGAYICRPVIHDQHIYLATIWSGDGSPGTGFISILDSEDRLVSAPGGPSPLTNSTTERLSQSLKIFTHPHDVCVDRDDNLYIPQWNSGSTYPIKLTRVP